MSKYNYNNFNIDNAVITLITKSDKVYENCIIMRCLLGAHHELIMPDNSVHKILWSDLPEETNNYIFYDYFNPGRGYSDNLSKRKNTPNIN